MGVAILVVAESGSGKSTSIESLDPKETFIINIAGKPLPFKGWKSKYKVWSQQTPTGNLYEKSSPVNIEACIKYVSDKRPEIKTIVVDDFQYMSSFEYFDRSSEKGYDKFSDIGAALAKVSRMPKDMRSDLTVVFLTHVEEGTDVEGNKRYKAKTVGKMIDNALTLEGLFSIVLFGRAKKNTDGTIRYIFETSTNGENTCKSPKGMFPSFEIPNDLALVRKCVQDYEQ